MPSGPACGLCVRRGSGVEVVPAVAVVIPVRDRVGMITEAVRSVIAQTWRDHALVVVDDGSTDGSAEAATAALRGAPAGS